MSNATRIAELRREIADAKRGADSDEPGGDPVRDANALPLLRQELAELLPRTVVTLKRMQREVGTGGKRPGYRWAPGYIIVNPVSLADEYPPVSFNEARARVREITGSASAYRII